MVSGFSLDVDHPLCWTWQIHHCHIVVTFHAFQADRAGPRWRKWHPSPGPNRPLNTRSPKFPFRMPWRSIPWSRWIVKAQRFQSCSRNGIGRRSDSLLWKSRYENWEWTTPRVMVGRSWKRYSKISRKLVSSMRGSRSASLPQDTGIPKVGTEITCRMASYGFSDPRLQLSLRTVRESCILTGWITKESWRLVERWTMVQNPWLWLHRKRKAEMWKSKHSWSMQLDRTCWAGCQNVKDAREMCDCDVLSGQDLYIFSVDLYGIWLMIFPWSWPIAAQEAFTLALTSIQALRRGVLCSQDLELRSGHFPRQKEPWLPRTIEYFPIWRLGRLCAQFW